jgi:serpin B
MRVGRRLVAGLAAVAALAALAGCGTAGGGAAPEEGDSRQGGGGARLAKLDTSEVPADGVDPMAWFGERLFPLVMQYSEGVENPVWSPLSVYLALGMAADGARGETAEQFAAVLAGDREAVNAAAAALLEDYAQFNGEGGAEIPEGAIEELRAALEGMEDREPVVRVADSIWVDDEFQVKDEFAADMADVFHAEAVAANLQDPKTVERINSWVADHTEGLINQILRQEDTDQLAVFLANALYFNGEWTYPALAEDTAPADFATGSGETVQADMMAFDKSGGGYLRLEDGTEGALLDYRGGRFAMLAVMPAGGVDAVRWDGAAVAGWLGQMQGKPHPLLTVKLPRWEADSGALKLIPVLQAAGLEAPFDCGGGAADLSGVGGDPGELCVSGVSHRAVVKVDELGTEAAAATGLTAINTSMPSGDPVTVTFDRPFVYSIVDTETGLPLFLGVVNNPTAA